MSDQKPRHPLGFEMPEAFHCARCGTLLDGGTDQPVAVETLRAEVERLLGHIHRIDHLRCPQDSCVRCRALRKGHPDTPAGWRDATNEEGEPT